VTGGEIGAEYFEAMADNSEEARAMHNLYRNRVESARRQAVHLTPSVDGGP
jgi:hypothetical protein